MPAERGLSLVVAACVVFGLACSGGGSSTPEWSEVIALVGSDTPFQLVNPETGDTRRWSPKDAEAPDALLGEPHFFLYKRLLTLSGHSWQRDFGQYPPPQVLSRDGRLAWVKPVGGAGALFVVKAADADPKQVAAPARNPGWRDDGWVCFDDGPSSIASGTRLACVDPAKPDAPVVVHEATIERSRWHGSGAVAWVDGDGVLWTLAPGGQPVRATGLDGLEVTWPLEWSPDGRHLGVGLEKAGQNGLAIVTGSSARIVLEPRADGDASFAAWSPDSAKLAFSLASKCWKDHLLQKRVCERDVHLVDAAGGAPRRLTELAYTDNPALAWVPGR
ncbi:MAG: hypothetical protein H6737_28595 [Alphaproteobacteria bacterium]|nr:hypothetical protein [Alphaproteobacteria bacterium]